MADNRHTPPWDHEPAVESSPTSGRNHWNRYTDPRSLDPNESNIEDYPHRIRAREGGGVVQKYPLDFSGERADNLIENEHHEIGLSEDHETKDNQRPIRAVVPHYTPFYTDSLEVYDDTKDRYLEKGEEYVPVLYYEEPSKYSALEVCAAIIITDPEVGDKVTIRYQTVGGKFLRAFSIVSHAIDHLDHDERPVEWGDLFGKPDFFPAREHLHPVEDLYGFEKVVWSLDEIRRAILYGDIASHEEILNILESRLGDFSDRLDSHLRDGYAHEHKYVNVDGDSMYGALLLESYLTVEDNAQIEGELRVDEDSFFDQNVYIGGFLGVAGPANVIGDTHLESELLVDDDARFESDATVIGNLYPLGDGTDSVDIGRDVNVTGNYATGVGYDVTASGDSSTAVGRSQEVTGDYAQSIGYENKAEGKYSTANGARNHTCDDRAVAVGYENEACGYRSSAVGVNNRSDKEAASSFGYNNDATGIESQALGVSNTASEINASAVGRGNTASGNQAIAHGYENQASAENASAMGRSSKASGSQSTATGHKSTASASSASAFGDQSVASGESSLAGGYQSEAQKQDATAVGRSALAKSRESTALGYKAQADGVNATGVGSNAQANATNAQAFGSETTADANGTSAVGYQVNVTGTNAHGLGGDLSVTGSEALALGRSLSSTAEQSVAIGSNAEATRNRAVVIGNSEAKATAVDAYGIGTEVSAKGERSLAVGYNATTVGEESVAIGRGAKTTGYRAHALGRDAEGSGQDTYAIGNEAKSSSSRAISLGHTADASDVDAMALGQNTSVNGKRSAAIGYGASTSEDDVITIGNSDHTVKIPGELYVEKYQGFDASLGGGYGGIDLSVGLGGDEVSTSISTPEWDTAYDKHPVSLDNDKNNDVVDVNLTLEDDSVLSTSIDLDDYVRKDGSTMTGDLKFDGSHGIYWDKETDGASIRFRSSGDNEGDSRLEFLTHDNDREYFRWGNVTSTSHDGDEILPIDDTVEYMTLDRNGLDVKGMVRGNGAYIYGHIGNGDSQQPGSHHDPSEPSYTGSFSLFVGDGSGGDTGGISIRTSDNNYDEYAIRHLNEHKTNCFYVRAKDGRAYSRQGFSTFSDRRLKENITIIEDALNKVMKVKGYTFNMVDNKDVTNAGIIAQELNEVLPEGVEQNSSDGMLSIKLEPVLGLIVQALNELNEKLERGLQC